MTSEAITADDFSGVTPAPTSARAPTDAPERSEKRQIAISAGSNVAVMAAKIALVFFVSPILVHKLGDARYGAWMFVNSLTAYLLLGDFGVKNAVMRFVARYDGLNDIEGINRVFNTSLALLSAVGATLLGVVLALGYFWGLPLKVPDVIRGETAWFFVLQAILVAMLLPVSLPNALLAGLGRFPARNAISLISLVLRQGMLVGVVLYGGGLIAIGAVLVAQCTIDFGMSFLGARFYFPTLTCSLRYVDRETLRTILGYSVNVFLGDVAAMVIGQSACVIIGAVLASPECVTFYSLGSSLKDYAVTILATVVVVLSPAVSKWQARGHDASIRNALAHAMRYMLYAAVAVELGLLILGYSFLSLWMGHKYADAGYTTLLILALSVVVSAINMVSARTLEGLGLVRPLAYITIAEAIATIGLGIPLARRFGIEGVAVGLVLALVLATMASLVLLCRFLKMSALRLLLRTCWAPSIAGAFAAAIWLVLQRWLPIGNWWTFCVVGIAGMVPFAFTAVLVEPDVRRVLAGLLAAIFAASARTRPGISSTAAESGKGLRRGRAAAAPAWQFWKLRNRVLLVGYSPQIPGGVTTVTQLLLGGIPELELHVAFHCYRPRWKAVASWLRSISVFAARLAVAPPHVVQIIIASHGDALRTLPYLVLAKARGCSVCLHFHKNFPAIFQGYAPSVRRLVLRLWRWAGHYCFLSQRLRDEFVAALPMKSAWVIPNPISETWLDPPLNPREQRTTDLAFFGRWSPEKGTDDLLAAMRGLAGLRCDVYSDRGRGAAHDNCAFHDWLAEDQVRYVLRRANVLLLPSRAEAFPTILLEAAACGTPFVAARLAGVVDIAEESRAGLLHDVGDVQGIREAVHRLVTDRRLWTELSGNGREWIASLSVAKVARHWQCRYAELGVNVAIASREPVEHEANDHG